CLHFLEAALFQRFKRTSVRFLLVKLACHTGPPSLYLQTCPKRKVLLSLFASSLLVGLGSAAPPRDFDDIEEHDALYKRGWPVRYVTGGGVMGDQARRLQASVRRPDGAEAQQGVDAAQAMKRP
uniref:FGE-sulfatase domain-containing protein n=1 Tax=Macrostomum lignano TaxID=282301 RepID=A0A1I8FFZ6_9PLAT